jgi:hypothetical protein
VVTRCSCQSQNAYFNSETLSLHWESKPRNVWGQEKRVSTLWRCFRCCGSPASGVYNTCSPSAADPPSHLLDQFALVSNTACCCFLQSGPMEGLTGNWLFHNFSAQYFDAERPITPFEIIPRVRTGPPSGPPLLAQMSQRTCHAAVHLFVHSINHVLRVCIQLLIH